MSSPLASSSSERREGRGKKEREREREREHTGAPARSPPSGSPGTRIPEVSGIEIAVRATPFYLASLSMERARVASTRARARGIHINRSINPRDAGFRA